MEPIATRARTVPWPVERTIQPTTFHDEAPQPVAGAARRRCRHARLQIEGLTRVTEAVGIEHHLFHEVGVIHVSVSPDTGIAYVIYDHDRVQAATLRRAIEAVGFGAMMI